MILAPESNLIRSLNKHIYVRVCNCSIATYIIAIFSLAIYLIIYTGDTGLRGPVGEAGIAGTKGAKGDQGDKIYDV